VWLVTQRSSPNVATSPSGLRAGLSFSVLGFPVRVRPEFFLIVAILGSGGGGGVQEVVSWIGVVFVSVLFHELGHALMGRLFGCNATIELYGMGGVTRFVRRDPQARPIPWGGDLAISLAGPFFGFLLGFAVYVAARSFPALHANDATHGIVQNLLYANIVWSVMNLAPILPYDGGLALRAVLVRISPRRGAQASHWVTVILGAVALALALFYRSFWLGYLAGRGVLASWMALRFDRSFEGAWRHWDAGEFEKARAGALQAAERGGANAIVQRAHATELSVLSNLALRDAAGAKVAFQSYPAGVLPSPLLRGIVALDGDDRASAIADLQTVPSPVLMRVLVPLVVAWGGSPWEDRALEWFDAALVEALPRDVTDTLGTELFGRRCFTLARHVLELRFTLTHSARDAYNVACCCARLGQNDAGLEWLGRALAAGWSDLTTLEADDDLQSVRALAGYAALRQNGVTAS
jgi:Zn-dependent protease